MAKLAIPSIPKRLKQVWGFINPVLVVIAYFALGVVVYASFETHLVECAYPPTGETQCEEPWTTTDALYFSMTTMSTVGYGDLSPGTDGTKFFTCVYIIIGVALVFPRMAKALTVVLHVSEKWINLGCTKMKTSICGEKRATTGVDINGDGTLEHPDPPLAIVHYGIGLWFPLTSMLVIILLLPAYAFQTLEPLWTYWGSVYHCWITATTVGYGDMTITKQSTRLLATIHIFLSTAWLLAILDRVVLLQSQRRRQLQQQEMMARSLDIELIKSMDKDGGGVDKLEFVIGYLITLGVELCGEPLTWKDVEPFIEKFEELDSDNSGLLSASDLERMVQIEQERIEARNSKRKSMKRSRTSRFTRRKVVDTNGSGNGSGLPRSPPGAPDDLDLTYDSAESISAPEKDPSCPEGEGGATTATRSNPFRSPFK